MIFLKVREVGSAFKNQIRRINFVGRLVGFRLQINLNNFWASNNFFFYGQELAGNWNETYTPSWRRFMESKAPIVYQM
jgi:hypothetical protein